MAPTTETPRRVSVLLPAGLLRRLDQVVQDLGETRSTYIRGLLRRDLDSTAGGDDR